jgi:hypothetical protein
MEGGRHAAPHFARYEPQNLACAALGSVARPKLISLLEEGLKKTRLMASSFYLAPTRLSPVSNNRQAASCYTGRKRVRENKGYVGSGHSVCVC